MLIPFTAAAKKALKGTTLSPALLERAKERILSSYMGKMLLEDDLAVFAAMRLVLGAMRNAYIVNRIAVNESKFYSQRIAKLREEEVVAIAKELGIDFSNGSVSLPSYLRSAPLSPHYALINRKVSKGRVEVSRQELIRMIQEVLRKRMEELPAIEDKDIVKVAKEIEGKLLSREVKEVKIKKGDFPPCVLSLLTEIKKHKNLPHHARWFLAVFLVNAGYSNQDILAIYKNLPDFKEKITLYQINHIRKKQYKTPSCATVMSYGLCRAACGITNPMLWGRLSEQKKRRLRNAG